MGDRDREILESLQARQSGVDGGEQDTLSQKVERKSRPIPQSPSNLHIYIMVYTLGIMVYIIVYIMVHTERQTDKETDRQRKKVFL